HFDSTRQCAGPPLHVSATYRPTGPPFVAKPGTLEHFLVERYCLYSRGPDGDLFCADIHHVPWSLQPAEGDVHADELFKRYGVSPRATPPLLHYTSGVDAVVWSLRPLTGPAALCND